MLGLHERIEIEGCILLPVLWQRANCVSVRVACAQVLIRKARRAAPTAASTCAQSTGKRTTAAIHSMGWKVLRRSESIAECKPHTGVEDRAIPQHMVRRQSQEGKELTRKQDARCCLLSGVTLSFRNKPQTPMATKPLVMDWATPVEGTPAPTVASQQFLRAGP